MAFSDDDVEPGRGPRRTRRVRRPPTPRALFDDSSDNETVVEPPAQRRRRIPPVPPSLDADSTHPGRHVLEMMAHHAEQQRAEQGRADYARSPGRSIADGSMWGDDEPPPFPLETHQYAEILGFDLRAPSPWPPPSAFWHEYDRLCRLSPRGAFDSGYVDNLCALYPGIPVWDYHPSQPHQPPPPLTYRDSAGTHRAEPTVHLAAAGTGESPQESAGWLRRAVQAVGALVGQTPPSGEEIIADSVCRWARRFDPGYFNSGTTSGFEPTDPRVHFDLSRGAVVDGEVFHDGQWIRIKEEPEEEDPPPAAEFPSRLSLAMDSDHAIPGGDELFSNEEGASHSGESDEMSY